MQMRNGGQILAQGLRAQGVELIFGVPGESYLAVLDALVDVPEIRYINARQEGGAALMAEAYGKLTGRPGVCFVTRGPGATNASAGLHVAMQDSTPMLLCIGQVGRAERDREAFQELDYRRAFGQLAKWVAEIDDPARIPEYLGRAFRVATSGRPGPVVLVLPEDMLVDTAQVADAAYVSNSEPWPAPPALLALQQQLATAERPVLLVGEGHWQNDHWQRLQEWVTQLGIPAACAFRCQNAFDNNHPHYIGDVGLGINPALAKRLQAADLIIALGTRLGEIVTNAYTLLKAPCPQQRLVHIHPGAEELGSVYQAELLIQAGINSFVASLPELEWQSKPQWREWTAAGRADYLAWTAPVSNPGSLQMAAVMDYLRQNLPADAIYCNGAGNYATWAHRFLHYRAPDAQLAPRSGSMGYGLPAAIAAKLLYPQRPVLCFAGDGCVQMVIQELGTAIQYQANLILCVVDNGAYGTIRMHQERHYPARISGTELVNPDFVALARAYGWEAARVETVEQFAAACQTALTADRPTLLHLPLALEALTPRQTLSEIRASALG